ncbi:uncharacterized protein LOC135272244 [Aotus nancymaae]|uniref:uncharacterized protein LOC135272244 n=1 Tax=Aotus nancymaae TaxID=37293 RepID=UPI0030FE8F80
MVLATHFISQSAADIRRKLKKAEEGPQTPMRDLVNMAFKVFNGREDKAEATRQAHLRQEVGLQTQALVAALRPAAHRTSGEGGPVKHFRNVLRVPPGPDSRTPITLAESRVKLQVAGWIEAFPTSRETADTVASILIQEIIPRFGLPATIQSDNGPAFIAQESWKQGPTTRTQYSATSSYVRSWTCPTLQSRCQPTDLSPLLRPYSAGSSQKERRPLSIIKRSECKVGRIVESSDTPPPLAGSSDMPPPLAGSSDTPPSIRVPLPSILSHPPWPQPIGCLHSL